MLTGLLALVPSVLAVAATHDLNVWELVVLALCWVFRRRLLQLAWARKLMRQLTAAAAHPWRAVIGLVLAAFLLRLLLLPIHPVPVPAITDEFSHLLLAETFTEGRFTNPVHPLWEHLESIHVIQRPSYNSMYFPGQAAFLALGMLLGHPWIGVLLLNSVLAGAMVWALQGWLPGRWALLGGIIGVFRFSLASYWVNSYWGGALAAVGGCLIAGAFGRMRRRPSMALGLTFGLGLALLSSARPLEGAVFGLAVIGSVLHQFGVPFRWRPSLWKAVAATAAVVAVCIGLIGFHFYKVTGDPLTPPYAINRLHYGWPMVLPGQTIVPVQHRHFEMQRYYDWELEQLKKKSSVEGFIGSYPVPFVWLWSFFLGPSLTLPFLLLRRRLSIAAIRPLLLWGGVLFVLVSLEFGYPHYYGPATICVIAAAVQGLRTLRASSRLGREGEARFAAVAVSCTVLAFLTAVTPPNAYGKARKYPRFLSWCCLSDVGRERAEVIAGLEAKPGKHVVFATSRIPKFQSTEWVYNAADIDSSRVIWMRDMGEARNREVLQYYPDRRFWVIDVDQIKPVPIPYLSSNQSSQASR